MSERNKIGWGWLAFSVVVMHFSMIFLYAFPDPYIPPPAKSLAGAYVYPFFEQTWSMFAPCPVIEHQLYVRFWYENDSTDWIDVYKEEQEQHDRLRFTHAGDQILSESNLLFFLEGDLQYMGLSLYEPIPPDSVSSVKNLPGYFRVCTYVRGYSIVNFDKEPLRASARCFFRNVATGESGTLELPMIEWK